MKTNKNTHENHKNKKPKTKKTTVLFSILTIATIIIAGFFLTSYAARETEKEIVVIIPSYNNIKWFEGNLSSIAAQSETYKNWHAIYIDDCSKDGTGAAVEKYIADHNLGNKITLIRNPENHGALCNLYNAIHSCKDNSIIVTLDGDDRFPDNQVLKYINKVYQDGKTWMTYGQFVGYPSGKVGHCRQIPSNVTEQNAFRYFTWLSSHLRTFYAGLFKKIKIEDLMQDGKFYSMTWDMAMMFPMLEMSGSHAKFLSKILYVYNEGNPISDWRKDITLTLSLDRQIREKERYSKLNSLN